tara:strand:- start:397 stop:663 length:267 start_codon:yes stop_codon:yes gene_type:complete
MEVNMLNDNKKWTMATYFWMGLVVWFCANLLSQAVFMGKFGEPYGKELLNQGLGPMYWGLIVIELSIYLFGIYVLGSKLKQKNLSIMS